MQGTTFTKYFGLISLSVFTLIILIFFSFSSAYRLNQKLIQIEKAYAALNNSQSVVLKLTECEAFARGYALTYNDKFMEAYNTRLVEIKKEVEEWNKDDVVENHQYYVGLLKQLINKRVTLLNGAIASANTRHDDMYALLVEGVNDGNVTMEKIKIARNELDREIQKVLAIHKQKARQNLKYTIISVLLAGCVAVFIAAFVVIMMHSQVKSASISRS